MFRYTSSSLKIIVCLFFTCISLNGSAQSLDTLKIHFLYGSIPIKKYKDEQKWFGGKLGGHVGVERIGRDGIFNFVSSGKFHVFQDKKNKHSKFRSHDYASFYAILGGEADSNKKLVIHIPINEAQKLKFDSITSAYVKETPYDYAFFGMRCGASAYDVLAQAGILKSYSYRRTWNKIFYPKKLRKQLLALARQNNWKTERVEGTRRRNWEND